MYTPFISTTPPGAITPLVRHQNGDNLVTVNRGGTNFNVRAIVQHQSAAVGGSWSGWSTIHTTSSITAKNATVTVRHVGVDSTRRHRYRTRYENVTDSPTLQGEWSSVSSSIELLARPNAPTGIRPDGQTLDASRDFPVSWQHNSVDGTDQTRRQLRTRVGGGTWDVDDEENGSTSTVLDSGRLEGGQQTEIQVRTWGEFPDASDWSAIATVYASERPEATITTPEERELLTGSSVTVAWSYFDAEETNQAAWEATLYDAFDSPLEFRSGSGTTAAATFLEQLDDDTTYQVGVRVRDGDRLWSDEVRTTFSTEFALPPAPSVSTFFDPETGAVVLHIGVSAPDEEEVEADHVQVWRGIDSDREVLIGERLAPGASFTDYLPHLVKPNYYRVVSVSTLPSVRSSVSTPVQAEEIDREEGWLYFNAGTGFERVIRVRADADVQVTQGREKAMRTFTGRTRPVEFSGEHETWQGSLSVKLSPSEPGHATRDDFAEIVQLPAPICYRDVTEPSGQRVFVSLGDFDHSQQGIESTGSIPFTRVEDPEIKHTDAALATGQLPGGGDSGEGE
ncbi:hypothetical protein [Nesterenkonia jeotgali]|uniref:hypothetical protein n=1 Tax=Nesterenkonia jeotgali TaxID=317018 RepID=UPI0012EDC673|nr:hypothetical protein [Nesterenkonia jeotgali]